MWKWITGGKFSEIKPMFSAEWRVFFPIRAELGAGSEWTPISVSLREILQSREESAIYRLPESPLVSWLLWRWSDQNLHSRDPCSLIQSLNLGATVFRLQPSFNTSTPTKTSDMTSESHHRWLQWNLWGGETLIKVWITSSCGSSDNHHVPSRLIK